MAKKLRTLMPLVDEKTGEDFIFAVDDDNKLYLNGDEIAMRQEVTLNRWVNLAIIAGGLATVFMALPTVWKIGCAVRALW